MKKVLICLLCAVLLCGLFACGTDQKPTAAEKTDEPIAAQPTDGPVAATDAPAFSESDARPLSFETDKNTGWTYNEPTGIWFRPDHYHLLIYGDGTAYLFTPNGVFALTENEKTFSLETRLFRTRDDTEPALTLPAGEVRLSTDGAAVKIEIVSDPIGVLADDGLDGKVLKKQDLEPGETRPEVNRFYVPMEPGTEWVDSFDLGERQYARLNMAIGENCEMTGTLRLPDGTQKNCVLLGNSDTYALVDETGELLFFGERRKPDDNRYDVYRYELVCFELDAILDPLDLCGSDTFSLCRDNTSEEEKLAYMIGRNLDTVVLTLIREDWTDRTSENTTFPRWFDEWFVLLQKDGQTLMIYYDQDYRTPYVLSESFADAFVLYGEDGAVLEWGGAKPMDHAIADGYRLEKGVYFNELPGVRDGLIVGDDDYVYFLDDGRIAIQVVPHEGGDGDEDFKIIKVIP